MRKILGIVVATLLFSCTIVERDNHCDSGGKNYIGCHLSSSSVEEICNNVGNYSCDISGYKTVKIGSQTWMAENLNCDVEGSRCYGEGGSVLNQIIDEFETLSNAEIQANCDRYGRLYDWCTAMAVCQNGWHLPSDDEWKQLVNFTGGDGGAGLYLKADKGWNDNEYGKSGNGEDTFGFSALPGGMGFTSGSFGYVGSTGYWWSATDFNNSIGSNAYYRSMYCDYEYVNHYSSKKNFLYSVRCVRD